MPRAGRTERGDHRRLRPWPFRTGARDSQSCSRTSCRARAATPAGHAGMIAAVRPLSHSPDSGAVEFATRAGCRRSDRAIRIDPRRAINRWLIGDFDRACVTGVTCVDRPAGPHPWTTENRCSKNIPSAAQRERDRATRNPTSSITNVGWLRRRTDARQLQCSSLHPPPRSTRQVP